MTRRTLLSLAALPPLARAAEPPIDRRAVVSRHNPRFHEPDLRAPLSVGNGEFAFTADFTGLQTFPELYEKTTPLCTQSQWGWHSFPSPGGTLKLEPFDTYGRPVGYATSSKGQEPLFNWLRENPHRLHLGRIGFRVNRADVTPVEQTLDLWSGILTSVFRLKGEPVTVRTCCHPERDMVAVEVRTEAPIDLVMAFPYGSPATNAADWRRPDAHRTTLDQADSRRVDLIRTLDSDRYHVSIGWGGSAAWSGPGAAHEFVLKGSGQFSFMAAFLPKPPPRASIPVAAETFDASAAHWARFWNSGGAIDLGGSQLERRVVLSQYLTAIQCAGSAPPQETGLTCNSWYGKFHLEMHWWHAAHFAMWGRTRLLERSLGWYSSILPVARAKARRQGYPGARWPKMTSLDGHDSPSAVGELLIWQQPHPISMAELCYQAHPDRQTLERYADLVMESAEFMASFAVKRNGRYALGPPVIPAQENHPPRETWNPTFELSYWREGLGVAQKWRTRLGLRRNPKWDTVRAGLAPLPVRDGVYLAHENCPQTYTERNRDHPSMLCAYGMLKGEGVDRETMRRTLHKVLREWRWEDTWGWDFPMVAMTAARLGDPKTAFEALFIESPKNTWLANGHNWQRANLPLYLPGNGALLAAIATMAGANAFPAEWGAQWEPKGR
jgi:protein-glucosylgalactosylhydroxylysine glucosidase